MSQYFFILLVGLTVVYFKSFGSGASMHTCAFIEVNTADVSSWW